MMVQERDGRVRRVRRPRPTWRWALGTIPHWLASSWWMNRRNKASHTFQVLLDVTDERVFA
jgi:hypothetical protein